LPFEMCPRNRIKPSSKTSIDQNGTPRESIGTCFERNRLNCLARPRQRRHPRECCTSIHIMNKMAEALDDIEKDILELIQFVEIYKAGVESPARMQDIARPMLVLARKLPAAQESVRKTMEALKRTADAYKRIVGPDFAYLYGVATVRIWTAFEAAMNDLCLARLEHAGFWKREEVLRGLKIELHEFVPAGEQEQVSPVFDALTDKHRAKHQPGAGRFENLLNSLGLGGPVPKPVADRLVWLSTARHCLVHRQGKIDARVLKDAAACGQGRGEARRARARVRARLRRRKGLRHRCRN
jgi:hypothetical protein